jgi:hypothetical protein
MFTLALAAGVICAVIVAAYFIAIDQMRMSATTNGGLLVQAPKKSLVKQLESLLHPFA